MLGSGNAGDLDSIPRWENGREDFFPVLKLVWQRSLSGPCFSLTFVLERSAPRGVGASSESSEHCVLDTSHTVGAYCWGLGPSWPWWAPSLVIQQAHIARWWHCFVFCFSAPALFFQRWAKSRWSKSSFANSRWTSTSRMFRTWAWLWMPYPQLVAEDASWLLVQKALTVGGGREEAVSQHFFASLSKSFLIA